jgi:hypothetical protein
MRGVKLPFPAIKGSLLICLASAAASSIGIIWGLCLIFG